MAQKESMVPQKSSCSCLVNLELFGTWMAKRRHIWQMSLLNARELARFCRDRELSFDEKDILRLWQLGWLQADIIEANRKYTKNGLIYRGMDYYNGLHIYSDERRLRNRSKGWEGAAGKLKSLPQNVQPLFHPFRYYVLYHLNRVLSLHISEMQALLSVERYPQLLELSLEMFRRWSSSKQNISVLESWNDAVSLVVATEPCMFEDVFHVLTARISLIKADNPNIPGGESINILRNDIAEHWEDVKKCYENIGLERIKQLHQDLCVATQFLDNNRNVHTLLRLAGGKSILELQGHLGGAIQLRVMAEILRRATEKTFHQNLREEDEIGIGWVPIDLKENLFGSARLLDGDVVASHEFVRRLGLNYGLRVRWYVEGTTEWNILHNIFKDTTNVDVVNLRGEVAQSNGLTFRDNLRADIRLGIFSFVSIDGDVSRNYQAVRKAAVDDEIVGAFYVSNPDFEFANFEHFELEEIIWKMATENGANPIDREKLHGAVKNAKNTEELLKFAKRALPEYLHKLSKGAVWGEQLMQYMKDHPLKQGKKRPIAESLERAIWSREQSYLLTKRDFKVDKDTGSLVKRA